jgi:hypothetical protein
MALAAAAVEIDIRHPNNKNLFSFAQPIKVKIIVLSTRIYIYALPTILPTFLLFFLLLFSERVVEGREGKLL